MSGNYPGLITDIRILLRRRLNSVHMRGPRAFPAGIPGSKSLEDRELSGSTEYFPIDQTMSVA